MKKEFMTPQMEIAVFESQNILTASGEVIPTAMETVQENITGDYAATVNADALNLVF